MRASEPLHLHQRENDLGVIGLREHTKPRLEHTEPGLEYVQCVMLDDQFAYIPRAFAEAYFSTDLAAYPRIAPGSSDLVARPFVMVFVIIWPCTPPPPAPEL